MSFRKKNTASAKSALYPGIGWTAFFFLLCFSCYFHAIKQKQRECEELLATIDRLEKIKVEVLEEKEDLALQISSQKDRNWVEMVLKKRLGVVPEGQIKVYFK